MPKMKTVRAAAKRFSKTGSGKFRYNKKNRRHILEKKARKRMRRLEIPGIVSPADHDRVQRMLPYA